MYGSHFIDLVFVLRFRNKDSFQISAPSPQSVACSPQSIFYTDWFLFYFSGGLGNAHWAASGCMAF